MPYAGTYGFQFSYAAIPFLCGMIAAGLMGRWRTSLVMAALLLAVKETTAAAVLGWGLYVFLFERRRKLGAAISVTAIVYALICVAVIIPSFATSGQYDRVSMFEGLGDGPVAIVLSPILSPGEFFGRLVRPGAVHFVLLSLAPLAMMPLIGWRLALASLTTLLPVLLITNEEWLSIKFWNQATILPVLYLAGVAAVAPRTTRATGEAAPRMLAWAAGRPLSGVRGGQAVGWALLLSAACGHYLFGFSPIARSYAIYATSAAMQNPDPRYAFVQRLQGELHRERSVLASERLAIHFLAFDRVYTGKKTIDADYVIIDRADTWDGTGLPQRVDEFANRPDYRVRETFGSIVVLERTVAAAPKPAGVP
jgi:hypothetical protein